MEIEWRVSLQKIWARNTQEQEQRTFKDHHQETLLTTCKKTYVDPKENLKSQPRNHLESHHKSLEEKSLKKKNKENKSYTLAPLLIPLLLNFLTTQNLVRT